MMKHNLFAFIFVLALVSCVNEELERTETAPVDQTEVVSHIYEAGEVAVRFSDEMADAIAADLAAGEVWTKSAGLEQLMESLGIKSIRRVFSDGGEFEQRRRAAGLHKWYYVSFDQDVPQTKAADRLSEIDGIEIAEPLMKTKINDNGTAWNDLSTDIWGMNNISNPGCDVNVLPVWRNYTVGDPKVIVGIFDDGVDITHEDLAGNCAASGHYNYVNNASNILPGDHGTHVAGIIGAVSNNGKGVCGVAGGDYAAGKRGVTLMAFQILTDDGAAVDKRNAYADAADRGVLISQNSWGYNYDLDGDGVINAQERENAKLIHIKDVDKAAIDYFINNAGCDANGNQRPDSPMKGGLVVFAAGNDAIPYGSPADYEPVIAVAAMTSSGDRSSFSSYGNWVDVCAPGTGIYSTVVGNEYRMMDGTSMACPYVSGVAALVLSYCGGPGFTADMLKKKIVESSNRTIINPSLQIGGLVDALGAISYGEQTEAEPVTDLVAEGRGDNIDLSWTLTADSEGKPAYSVTVLYGKNEQDVIDATVKDHSSSVGVFVNIPEGNVGDKVSCTIPNLDFDSEYFLKMLACTYSMNYSEPTEVITVSTTKNNPPVITVLEKEYKIKAYESLAIPVTVADPDGHAVSVEYVKGSDADEFAKQPDGSWKIILTGNKADAGTYQISIKAVDSFGMQAQKTLTYVIESNLAPVILKELDDVTLYSRGAEFTIDMTEYVSDPDGEALKYDINVADAQIAHITAQGNILYGTALKYGNTGVEIKVSDARGEFVNLAFNLLVKDPAKPVSVYPNPVTDWVNIGTLDSAETLIRIYNSTGKLMHESTSMVSGHEPAIIDMSGFAPGVYTVMVSFGGNKYTQTVVKL